mmetsp:Transcript_16347/g.24641  ORF Transcript_16347/g.24641 Transcript_16347/m.24641 type:complete len:1163 (+) Transcript_16347:260-3748(+)|eukprot:CAMPEP_0185038828 /NCGR_PEP_ID=MMETSP1103-20130426/34960_1 /TAXON_ID=36769 /ORGANISM="Paraphysomonas bandaiensis, Strain Caron Lab Isolate" /LENGTH=1162 /DNA_ID=CAMNT_0027577439 /DNA_START=102 /DNA_END=3590 /DNA_ORIENTATION=-
MNNEVDNDKIEQLRQRYRREAQIAVDDARNAAREETTKKYEHKIKNLEDEVRQWKAIVEALSSEESDETDDNSSKHVSLVRYIMEQIYREFKREYSDGSVTSQAVTTHIKKSLISTTEKLLEKLPNLVLKLEVPSNKSKKKEMSSTFGIHRPPCLQIVGGRPLALVPYVMLTIDERPSTGVFNKAYVAYCIQTKVYVPDDVNNARHPCPQKRFFEYQQFRRYSDFLTFQYQLQRLFPRCIIPPLPPKTPGPRNDKIKGEKHTEARRRHLILWLQYVLLHSGLQRSPVTRSFVTTASSNTSSWEVDPQPDGASHGDVEKSEATNEQVGGEEEVLYEGDFKNSSPGNRASLPPDTLSEHARYKCQQEMHSVTRDYNQLKPNIRSGVDACRALLDAMREVGRAHIKFSSSLSSLADVEDGEVEKAAATEVQLCTDRSLSLLHGVVFSMCTHVLEPMQFLEVDSMAVSSNVMHTVHKTSTKNSRNFIDAHADLVREWGMYRSIRHDMLTRSLLSMAHSAHAEYGRIARHWSVTATEIESLNTAHASRSNAVSRGWSGLMERERKEMADVVQSLNDAHEKRKVMQGSFSSAGFPNHASQRTDSASRESPELRHTVASRPVIPSGTRRDPTERVFYPVGGDSNISPRESSREVHTEEYSQAQESHSEPHDSPAGFPQEEPATPPSSKKSGWTSYFWRSSSKKGHEKGAVGTSSANKAQSPSASTVSPSTNAAPVSFLSDRVETGKGDDEDDEESLEDTPMNRAYMERRERERRQAEERQHNGLNSAGGLGAGEERPEDILTGGDKRNTRRRVKATVTATSGSTQRRPKHIPSKAYSGTSASSTPRSQDEVIKPVVVPQMPKQPAPSSEGSGRWSPPPSRSPAHPVSGRKAYSMHSEEALRRSMVPPESESPTQTRKSSSSAAQYSSPSPVFIPPSQTQPHVQPDDIPPSPLSQSAPAQSFVPSRTRAQSDAVPATGQAEASRLSPLPAGWEEVHTDDGGTYYYHRVTRISRWEKPSAEVAAAVESRISSSQKNIDEAVEKKRREREKQRALEEQRSIAAEQLHGTVKQYIVTWKTNPTNGKEKHIGELLTSLPGLLGPDVCPPGTVGSAPLGLMSTPVEIKKAYMKAVRVIHPDKLSATIELEKRLLAEEAFICLNQVYDVYRKAHGI